MPLSLKFRELLRLPFDKTVVIVVQPFSKKVATHTIDFVSRDGNRTHQNAFYVMWK